MTTGHKAPGARLLGVLVFGVVLAAQVPPLTTEEREVLTLAMDMARAKSLDQWLTENKAAITPQAATTADGLADRFLVAQRPNESWALYSFAGMTHLRTGNRPGALRSMANGYQVRFLVANTPAEYRSVRSDAVALIKSADSVGAADTAFRLAILAADCTFFTGVPSGDRAPDGAWLIATLDDLTVALERASSGRSRGDFERLVSLTQAAVTSSLSHLLREQDQIETRLQKIAALIETAIPVDFAYQTELGNQDKTMGTARALAELAYRHGRAASGSARLAFVADRAKRAGDLDEYLSTIHLRYRGERRTASPVQLRDLRTAARSVATDIRRGYRSRAGRIWNSYEFDGRYGEMLDDEAADAGTANMASLFEATESMKARTLLDEIRQRPLPEPPAALQPRVSELEQKILGFAAPRPDDSLMAEEMRLASQLSGFSTFSSGPNPRVAALADIEKLYADNALGFTAVTSPASLKAIQDALQPGEALIEYVIPYHPLHPAYKLVTLLITRTSAVHVYQDLDKVLPRSTGGTMRMSADGRAALDVSGLGEQVVILREALRRADDKVTRAKLSGFYQLLIQPLVERGFRPEQYARLVVVPHGVLHYVPFLALTDGGGIPLIRKTAVTTAPSASVWLALQSRAAVPVSRWLAFANPALKDPTLPSLESSAAEVKRISSIVSGLQPRIDVAAAATRARFLSSAPTASLLHLATHGEFPDDNALDRHGLLLAPGAGDDGVVRAMDIRRLDLSAVRLAVLSVCNGGLYRIGPADEPYGLVPAFLLGGAQNVAATLWPVDDPFARRFTVEFYTHLLEVGPAEALRRAAIRFIDEDELVRRWAGFIVVGPGRAFRN